MGAANYQRGEKLATPREKLPDYIAIKRHKFAWVLDIGTIANLPKIKKLVCDLM